MNNIPIKKGDEIIAKIESIGRKGDGVTKIHGFVIVIPQTEIGKIYQIQITETYEKYAFGRVIKKVNNKEIMEGETK